MAVLILRTRPAPALRPGTGDACHDLYSSICEARGETRSPAGTVRSEVEAELEALGIYEKIIDRNPAWTSDEVDRELARTIYTPKRRRRVQGAYRWTRRALERFIERQPSHVFSRAEKRKLKERIKRTRLELPPPVSVYADEPDLLTKNDVYYQRLGDGSTRLRVGGAYLLTTDSWFNLVFTLSHELAHAIDPCELRAARLSFASYGKLTSCFLENRVIAARETRSECGRDDQLSEAFADWVAVEIVSEALKKFATEFDRAQLFAATANSVRDLCVDASDPLVPDLTHHPPPRVRIEDIFGGHPLVRQLLGCREPATGYCTFDWNGNRFPRRAHASETR